MYDMPRGLPTEEGAGKSYWSQLVGMTMTKMRAVPVDGMVVLAGDHIY